MTGCPRLPGLLGNGLRRAPRSGPVPVPGRRRAVDQREHVPVRGRLAVRSGHRRPPALRRHRARRPGLPGHAGGPDPRGRRRPADPGVPVSGRSQVPRRPDRWLARLRRRADRVGGRPGARPRGRGHRRERVPDRRPGRAEAGNPAAGSPWPAPSWPAGSSSATPSSRPMRTARPAASTSGRPRPAPRWTRPGCRSGAEMVLAGRCEVTGRIDMSMSDVSSVSIGADCVLRAPGRTALDLTNAQIRALLRLDERAAVEGTIRMAGAVIRGMLALHGELSQPGARVAGRRQRDDRGRRRLPRRPAHRRRRGHPGRGPAGQPQSPRNAQLHNPGGYSLRLSQAVVNGPVRLIGGFSSTGLVVLNRSHRRGPAALHRRLVPLPRAITGQRARARDRGDFRHRAGQHRPRLGRRSRPAWTSPT